MTDALTDSSEPVVVRNDAKSRYELRLDDTVAGYTEFAPDEHGRVVFPHTIVDPAFGGRGWGSTLVAGALADMAARGETVVPVCPFVVKYLRRHEVPGLSVFWRPTVDEAGAEDVYERD